MKERKNRFQTQKDFNSNGCSEKCLKDEKVTRSLFCSAETNTLLRFISLCDSCLSRGQTSVQPMFNEAQLEALFAKPRAMFVK